MSKCRGIRLLDESGVVVVESTAPLAKSATHAHAKALKHGAADEIGPMASRPMGGHGAVARAPAWRPPFPLQRVLDEVFDGRVFDWTQADAEACANIMEAKRRLGEPLDHHLPDAMIAATAVTRRLTVLTRNESEFRSTGVAWVNPWTGLVGFVQQALVAGSISMGRAAELLQVGREEMREFSKRWALTD